MAEAGCLYHTSWIIDDQPWPINLRGGQKFIYVPYTGQTNDAGMLAWNREADYFLQMIKDQFDTLYREGAENGRVMCLSLRPLLRLGVILDCRTQSPAISASDQCCIDEDGRRVTVRVAVIIRRVTLHNPSITCITLPKT
jgi:hypothetical protein